MNGLKEFVVLWQILDYQGVDSIFWLFLGRMRWHRWIFLDQIFTL